MKHIVPTLSIAILCYNEAETIAQLLAQLAKVLGRMKLSHEMILVGDGSGDASLTIGFIRPQYKK